MLTFTYADTKLEVFKRDMDEDIEFSITKKKTISHVYLNQESLSLLITFLQSQVIRKT